MLDRESGGTDESGEREWRTKMYWRKKRLLFIFFEGNRRGLPLPSFIITELKGSRYKKKSRNKERYKENRNNYTKLYSHRTIKALWAFLALSLTQANSRLMMNLQDWIECWTFQKIASFRRVQIAQNIAMIISMKNVLCIWILNRGIVSRKLSWIRPVRPRVFQHDMSKGQWRNKWCIDSSVFWWQRTQL